MDGNKPFAMCLCGVLSVPAAAAWAATRERWGAAAVPVGVAWRHRLLLSLLLCCCFSIDKCGFLGGRLRASEAVRTSLHQTP